jgi:hypothetical protein
LLKHQPTVAATAGLVAQARAEEVRLRQAGLPDQAAAARQLGIQALTLERQQYLEGFKGVQVDRQFAYSLRPKDGENPADVLKASAGGSKDLGNAGTGPNDVPGLLGTLIEECRSIRDDIKAAMTN